MQWEPAETRVGQNEYESLAAQERDFLAHLAHVDPEVDDRKDVDDPAGDLDVADRDFLHTLNTTYRQSATLAQTARTLCALADIAAGCAAAALVAIATFLVRHDSDLTRPLVAIASAALVVAVTFSAAGSSVITMSGYVDLRTRAIERRWIDSED